jgi:hypothetical protein
MAISADERRFLRYWEEQSKGGKWNFVPVYSLGFFIMLFMAGVAVGLFLNLPFVRLGWLVGLGIISVVGAFALALGLWHHQYRKFRQIIQREMGAEKETP